MATGALRDAGLDIPDRPGAAFAQPATPRLRTAADPASLMRSDPRYGQVVCACELVSAAEIAAALDGPVPARSVEGVRKRTGATYGRCQGSICMAGISFMCGVATDTGPDTVRGTDAGTIGVPQEAHA